MTEELLFSIMLLIISLLLLAIAILFMKNKDLVRKEITTEAVCVRQRKSLEEQLKEVMEQRDEALKNVKHLEIEWVYKYRIWLANNLETANHNISAYEQRWKKEEKK